MNRQKLTLAILLVLLVLAVMYSVFGGPQSKKAATTPASPRQTGTKATAPKAFSHSTSAQKNDKKLHLALLDREYPKFSGFRRNLFAPIFHEEQKAEPRPSGSIKLPVPPPPPPIKPGPPPVSPGVQVPEPTPLQREMAKFTFLGFLKKDNKKTIFLSSGKEIFLVKRGDTIAGKYEVSNLTDEALTIHPLGEEGEIVIPLVENRALAAPKR